MGVGSSAGSIRVAAEAPRAAAVRVRVGPRVKGELLARRVRVRVELPAKVVGLARADCLVWGAPREEPRVRARRAPGQLDWADRGRAELRPEAVRVRVARVVRETV